MTDKRFKYGSNERWECVLIDTLEKKEYDFCEVGKLCNRLWEQTQRFENHNKDLMEENEQLKQSNEDARHILKREFDFATEQREKYLDDPVVTNAYDIIRFDMRKALDKLGWLE